MSYNRDLQEDKAVYFEAVDTVHDGLALMAAMLDGATWRTERLRAAASDPLIAATDLADHLVRQGMPFRRAHEVVGHIVKAAESSGRGLADLSLDELRAFSPLFDDSVVSIGPDEVTAARDVLAAPRLGRSTVSAPWPSSARSRHRAGWTPRPVVYQPSNAS
jgi:argininosuccinate lyase